MDFDTSGFSSLTSFRHNSSSYSNDYPSRRMPNQTRWTFDDLNSEKQYLDSMALKLMSSYATEYGYPSLSLDVKSPKKTTISEPHRINQIDISDSQKSNSIKQITRTKKRKHKTDIEDIIFSESSSDEPEFDFSNRRNETILKEINYKTPKKIHRIDPKKIKQTMNLVEENQYIDKQKSSFEDESDDIDDFVDSIHSYARWKI